MIQYGIVYLEYRELETAYPEWRGYKQVPIRQWIAQYSGRRIVLFEELVLLQSANNEIKKDKLARANLAKHDRLCARLMEAVGRLTAHWEDLPREWLILPDLRRD